MGSIDRSAPTRDLQRELYLGGYRDAHRGKTCPYRYPVSRAAQRAAQTEALQSVNQEYPDT